MKNSGTIWGILIIAIGIIFLGNNFNLWNFELFFDGWWTLFIIIPSLIGITKKEFVSSFIGLAIGVLLLLACQNVIEWKAVGQIFIPVLLIIIGLSLIFKPKVKNIGSTKNGLPEYVGVFASNENIVTDEFNGSSIVAVFGGVTLDLRKAKIKDDIIMDCVTVFGGIDLILPDNVRVKISGVPIFGGVENKITTSEGKTVTINYVCIFAGIDVK